MSAKQGESRVIHPRALAELGQEACIVALGVARDLRSGVIPPKEYNQMSYCGSACCIAGHMSRRLDLHVQDFLRRRKYRSLWPCIDGNPHALFSGGVATPRSAADAIERYVYDGSETPWKVS